jgi:hypothetical protein
MPLLTVAEHSYLKTGRFLFPRHVCVRSEAQLSQVHFKSDVVISRKSS